MVVPKVIIEFNGHVVDFSKLHPVFDGCVLDNKTLARLCMSLLRDYGYPDDDLHRMPPILYHFERLKLHDARQCLYVVCNVLVNRPFIPWDKSVIYRGTHFCRYTDIGYKQCYNVALRDSLNGSVICSSLCTIDEVALQVNEYLEYHRSYSHIIIN